VLRLLEDESLRKKFAERGRERVYPYFTVDYMVDRIAQLYERLLREKGLI